LGAGDCGHKISIGSAAMTAQFSPGALIHARGREWVVVDTAGQSAISVRPLGGANGDIQILLPQLEAGLRPAQFSLPTTKFPGGSSEARLLRDSTYLNLRRGAGPFRSFGRLSFEPRAYQLAPLLMALKLDPIRLLIADDVGIGKTIEAGLIAREMLDRGEINRFSVVCPPHLVEQWVGELKTKFGIEAVAVTSSLASRLERGLPIGVSLFEMYPFTVVSLDLVKADRRRNDFAQKCPNFVIVDEAHSCVGTGEGRKQQRFELLQRLAQKSDRHILLMTATPHCGDASAYSRLVTLLDPSFGAMETATGETREKLRLKLGEHLIQRRQKDIETRAWGEGKLFPVPEKKEETYRLHPEAAQFFSDVLDYCADVTERAGSEDRKRRLAFWGTLALMRCVASSPVAAVQALKSRAKLDEIAAEDERAIKARAFDGDDDESREDDGEGSAIEDPKLAALYDQALKLALAPGKDEKLKKLRTEIEALINAKPAPFNVVIFCRFIATAKGVGAALEGAFPNCAIDVITGEIPSDERRARVEAIGAIDDKPRILVATDCLSEGINLQSYFNAVVHYDLSWNPTRHQQREGRVNRFGQRSPTVRMLLIYGENNPVDGAVLQVILRKAERIRKETGVPVPLPDDERALTEALMKAVMLRRDWKQRSVGQGELFDSLPEARQIDKAWEDASEREKQSQTIFAQRALKPEDVIPEWKKALDVLGGTHEQVKTFFEGALARLGKPLTKQRGVHRFTLPDNGAFRDRLAGNGIANDMRVSFLPGPGQEFVHRTHPLVATAAEMLFERTLDPKADAKSDIAVLGRCGAWITKGVTQRTTVALLRLRHRLIPADGKAAMLAEEASALAWTGNDTLALSAEGVDALKLLDLTSEADLADATRAQRLQAALAKVSALTPDLEAHAKARAEILGTDHDRVRAATMRDRRTRVARVKVEPVIPVDIIGLYVLIPDIA
jgi:superfamily II DNA or RNA helicase